MGFLKEFVRGFFVYDDRLEFARLFTWVGVFGAGLLVYHVATGQGFGIFEGLVLLYSGAMFAAAFGLRRRWSGARWLGALALVAFALFGWLLDLVRGSPDLGSVIGLVMVAWAVQLVRLDFSREAVEEALAELRLHVPLGVLTGQDLSDFVERQVEAGLAFHLREHSGDWASCEDPRCDEFRIWEKHADLGARVEQALRDAPPADDGAP